MKRIRRSALAALLGLLPLAVCSPAWAGSIGLVVSPNDGGYGSLRDIVRDLPSGGVVRFAPQVSGMLTLTLGELVIEKDLTIEGPGASTLSLNGNGRRLFRIEPGRRLALLGVALMNGRVMGTNGDGGIGVGWNGAEGESV